MTADGVTSSVLGMNLPPRHVLVHENDLGTAYVVLQEAMRAGLIDEDIVQPILTTLDQAVEITNLHHFRGIVALLDEDEADDR